MQLPFLKTTPIPSDVEEVRQVIEDYLFQKKSAHSLLAKMDYETNLKDELAMDSLDIVELILHLENRYGIDFDEIEDIPNLETIGSLAGFTYQVATQG